MNWLVLIFALATSPVPDQATQWEIRIEELEGRTEMLESQLTELEKLLVVPKGEVGLIDSSVKRDPKQVDLFKKDNPCPSTQKVSGPCPTHIVDHIIPLSLCGPDRPDNMQWQTVKAAKIKDRLEFEAYTAKHKGEEKLKVQVECIGKLEGK